MPRPYIDRVNYEEVEYDIYDTAHGTLTRADISTGTDTAPKFITAKVFGDAIGNLGGGTVTSVGLSNASGESDFTITGTPITASGTITIEHANSVTAKTTQALYPIKFDKHGHITGAGTAVTLPTKVSDLTNDSGFITGGANSSSNVTITPTTTSVYSMTSDGTVPTLTFTRNATDTKQLDISWSAGTMPSRSQVNSLWNGVTSAVAGAQTFTGTNNVQSVGGNVF